MNVLLTGATGFLGSHLLEALLKDGHNVVVLKRSTSDAWRIKELVGKFKSYDVDLGQMEDAFRENEINIVIHTACNYGRDNANISILVETNLLFGAKIIDLCIQFNVKMFINTDTFFNTGELKSSYLDHYALSKRQFVDWLRLKSLKMTILNLRIHHMYGAKDSAGKFVPWLLDQFRKNKSTVNLTRGENIRDFIYIDDVVCAFIVCINKWRLFSGYNETDVGTGVLTTTRKFVETFKSIYELENGDLNLNLCFGALEYKENEIMNVAVHNDLIMDIGWCPKHSLEDGILKLLVNEACIGEK